jgi:molecular chaperone GrpE
MKEEEEKINQEEILENEEAQETAETSENTENQETAAEEPAEEKDPLEAAKEEIEQLKTQMLYKTAEFDNFRRRTLKEKSELMLNGGEKAITAILPIIDDMERAIENGAKTDDPAVLREGMELIYNKFIKALEGQGVKKIDTKDADFNTDLHEAVAMVPGMGDDKKGKVIDCLQAGYQLNDKVIRHAKVAVGQ